jgi:hypothetical protein
MNIKQLVCMAAIIPCQYLVSLSSAQARQDVPVLDPSLLNQMGFYQAAAALNCGCNYTWIPANDTQGLYCQVICRGQVIFDSDEYVVTGIRDENDCASIMDAYIQGYTRLGLNCLQDQ